MIASFITSALFMIVFYAFFTVVFYVGGGAKVIYRLKFWTFIWVLIISFAALVFVYLTVRQNHFIYYWDYGGYWTLSVQQMQQIFSDPILALAKAYISICVSDYNKLLPCIVSLPLYLFGCSFVRYTLINAALFLIPTAFVITAAAAGKIRLSAGKSFTEKDFLLIFSAFLLFPPLYPALFKGSIDAAGLLPSALLILLLIDYNGKLKLGQSGQCMKNVMIALLLLTTFLFRRYYAYFCIGYIAALIFLSLQKKSEFSLKQDMLHCLANVLMIGMVAASVLFLLFPLLVYRIFTTDYSVQYAAYNLPLGAKLKNLIGTFGLIDIGMAGVTAWIIHKNRTLVNLFIGSWICIVVSVALFFRVQEMNIHHRYIVVLPLFLLIIPALSDCFEKGKKGIMRIVSGICIVLFLVNFMQCYFNVPGFTQSRMLFSDHYEPMIMNDMDEIVRIKDHLNELTKGNKRGVYVAASGTVLNADILRSADKPVSFEAVHNLRKTSDVDLRDGFPNGFLDSEIVVTTKPVQLHLAEGTQETVRFLAEEVMNSSSPVGRHFTMESEYSLDEGVKACIYIRTSKYDEQDIKYIRDYFDSKYPDYPKLFHDRI